jgi:hypothetical protein
MRMDFFRVVLLFIVTVVAVITFGAHAIAADADPMACPRTLPANIDLPRDLERMLTKIYRASATFRGQCDRIAAAGTLSVNVRLDTNIPSSCMAFTRFQKKGRAVYADVHLPPSAKLMAQLVGHEFEHIVEQLDGLDLPILSRVRKSGVYQTSFEVYESTRAQRVGRSVALEVATPQAAD